MQPSSEGRGWMDGCSPGEEEFAVLEGRSIALEHRIGGARGSLVIVVRQSRQTLAHLAIRQLEEVSPYLNVPSDLVGVAVARRHQMVQASQGTRRCIQLAGGIGDA